VLTALENGTSERWKRSRGKTLTEATADERTSVGELVRRSSGERTEGIEPKSVARIRGGRVIFGSARFRMSHQAVVDTAAADLRSLIHDGFELGIPGTVLT